MEKQQASKPNKIHKLLKLLPRPVTSWEFGLHAPPYSPGRDHLHHSQRQDVKKNGVFSRRTVSIVPIEARIRRNGDDDVLEEPTSPKVSCMGQVKLPKSKAKTVAFRTKHHKTVSCDSREGDKSIIMSKTKPVFNVRSKAARISETAAADESPAPSLDQVKRFAGGRAAFANVDLTAKIAPVETSGARHRDYFPIEVWQKENEIDRERNIRNSGPMLIGGAVGSKPEKQSLGMSRTMSTLRPLRIKAG